MNNEIKPLDAAELERLRTMTRDEEVFFFPATVQRIVATLDAERAESSALKAAIRWREEWDSKQEDFTGLAWIAEVGGEEDQKHAVRLLAVLEEHNA